MNRFTLDTSAYVHFRKQHSALVALLDAADWIGVPSVVLGELWAAFLQSRRREENVRLLGEFMGHPYVTGIPVDSDVPRLYGELLVELRRAGTPVPTNDVWIAACAISSASTLVTFDSHFDSVPRVQVLMLTPE